MFFLTAVLTMGLVSCADAEEGESRDAWVMRNQLNSDWGLDYVVVNGEYRGMGEEGFDFYLTLKYCTCIKEVSKTSAPFVPFCNYCCINYLQTKWMV